MLACFKPFQGWFPILTSLHKVPAPEPEESFKPFQGWFPILTQRRQWRENDGRENVSNPSRDDFLFWPTWPCSVCTAGIKRVSNPSRDDFLFWHRRLFSLSSTGCAGFKPFQGWFPILTVSLIFWIISILIPSFKPFQGWFPILTFNGGIATKRFNSVSNPSRDDFLFWQIMSFFGNSKISLVSNPSRDDFLFWLGLSLE